mmetsp:Transcript_22545/g.35398  ORF Transcript_22545/g.35398 Transcript_22545/m.35398 type:complete len:107 (+) Transcript_22545:1300-1620(+)
MSSLKVATTTVTMRTKKQINTPVCNPNHRESTERSEIAAKSLREDTKQSLHIHEVMRGTSSNQEASTTAQRRIFGDKEMAFSVSQWATSRALAYLGASTEYMGVKT